MFGSYHDIHNCNHTLRKQWEQTPTDPIIGEWQFYHLNMIVSGVCCAFSTVLVVFLMFMHAMHFSKPLEQLEILRICVLVPIYSILVFAGIYEANAYVFVKPWIEVAQGFALANYWILVCRFLAPEGETDRRTIFFAPMHTLNEVKRRRGKKPLTLNRYRRHWFYILQGPVVTVIIAIATNFTEVAAHFCVLDEPGRIRTGLTCATIASMAAAMVTAIRHSSTLRSELWPYRAMFKMLSFKLLLGLYIILEVIYIIMEWVPANPLRPSALLSEADVEVGIPLMATSCELVLFAIFFYYAYSVTPYRLAKVQYFELQSTEQAALKQEDHSASYQGGFLGYKAWLRFFNHREMFEALKFPFHMLDDMHRG